MRARRCAGKVEVVGDIESEAGLDVVPETVVQVWVSSAFFSVSSASRPASLSAA